ncbi:hypothetical protein J5N97_026970 [Dioscorea zingiberensis]|uniref:J domain-containing protein n=1 Tax=Dioscorea zingiberensis TaxID=325984 RepID=A0A9D5C4F6_9LILI|nr:hypothetical protein J5N97_026970 [Dioscorea zingiberensis]
MAAAVGLMLGSMGSSSSSSCWSQRRGDSKRASVEVRCVASGSLNNQYRTLRVQPGASETEVKRAFRQLALQYHPDVCKGSNCGVQFHRINEAYDIVMKSLRKGEEEEQEAEQDSWCHDDDEMRGMYDSSWELWEEWMGWEGAGILDYTSHINPYI